MSLCRVAYRSGPKCLRIRPSESKIYFFILLWICVAKIITLKAYTKNNSHMERYNCPSNFEQ